MNNFEQIEIMFKRIQAYANSPKITALPLFSRIHFSFENWFIRQFQRDLLPTGKFSIMDMRQEYLDQCQKEEMLWKEWCDNVKV